MSESGRGVHDLPQSPSNRLDFHAAARISKPPPQAPCPRVPRPPLLKRERHRCSFGLLLFLKRGHNLVRGLIAVFRAFRHHLVQHGG